LRGRPRTQDVYLNIVREVDVDSERMTLRIEQCKGRPDRYAMLSPVVLERLRAWWRVARPRWWNCSASFSDTREEVWLIALPGAHSLCTFISVGDDRIVRLMQFAPT